MRCDTRRLFKEAPPPPPPPPPPDVDDVVATMGATSSTGTPNFLRCWKRGSVSGNSMQSGLTPQRAPACFPSNDAPTPGCSCRRGRHPQTPPHATTENASAQPAMIVARQHVSERGDRETAVTFCRSSAFFLRKRLISISPACVNSLWFKT